MISIEQINRIFWLNCFNCFEVAYHVNLSDLVRYKLYVIDWTHNPSEYVGVIKQVNRG